MFRSTCDEGLEERLLTNPLPKRAGLTDSARQFSHVASGVIERLSASRHVLMHHVVLKTLYCPAIPDLADDGISNYSK